MKLTHELLMQHRTPKQSWTRLQLQALGIDWPPRQDWIEQVVGKELTNRQWLQFTGKNLDQADLFD